MFEKNEGRIELLSEGAIIATVDEIKIIVKAEVDQAISKFMELDKTTQKTQSTFAKMRDVMQGPIAAFNTVLAVIGKVKAVSDKMENAWAAQEEALAILDSTLRATGATAWTSAEKLSKMASGFQSVTKYGDETVLAMQNVLLGFKNIKGDNFEDASLQILNMATVMKMDLTSAAQAVGKALDNPILGLDSLSRQGFKFTAQEKELIKTLVEAGKLEDAQGIILKELATTYGGAAEAAGKTGTAIKVKLQNAIGDVNEEIGRSISNSLKPWREKWLEMATAIGAAAKAQNDFKEALENQGKGAADERLNSARIVLAGYSKELEKYRETISAGLNTEVPQRLLDQVYNQSQLVKGLELQAAAEKKVAAATTEAAKKAAEQEKAAAEAALKQAEAVIKLEELGTPSAESIRMAQSMNMERKLWEQHLGAIVPAQEEVNRLLIDEAEYQREVNRAIAKRTGQGAKVDEDPRVPALKEAIDLTKELTETQKAQQDAVVSGYQAMAEALGSSLISGEDGWKAFGRAGLNAIAGVIEAMAIESDALIAQATAQALLGDFTKIPGLGAAIAASVAAHSAAGLVRAIPMAEGGSGVVTKPTLFLAGEKGPEPYAFGGANNKLGMGMTQNIYIGGSVIRESEVGMLGAAQLAKAGRGY
ncbi:MAG: hypothetical protein WC481_07585 [Candidatus Omnitrophota bacterium]